MIKPNELPDLKCWLRHDVRGFPLTAESSMTMKSRVQVLICSGTHFETDPSFPHRQLRTNRKDLWSSRLCVFNIKTCLKPSSPRVHFQKDMNRGTLCPVFHFEISFHKGVGGGGGGQGFTGGVLLALNPLKHDDFCCYKLVYSREAF